MVETITVTAFNRDCQIIAKAEFHQDEWKFAVICMKAFKHADGCACIWIEWPARNVRREYTFIEDAWNMKEEALDG